MVIPLQRIWTGRSGFITGYFYNSVNLYFPRYVCILNYVFHSYGDVTISSCNKRLQFLLVLGTSDHWTLRVPQVLWREAYFHKVISKDKWHFSLFAHICQGNCHNLPQLLSGPGTKPRSLACKTKVVPPHSLKKIF